MRPSLPPVRWHLYLGSGTAALAWLAVLWQGVLSTGSVANLLSYFTILSNLAVAGSLTLALGWPTSALGRASRRVSVQTAVALYILVVALVYNTVLRGLLTLTGAAWIVDNLLHVVVPGSYLGYWYFVAQRGRLAWQDMVKWLGFPAGYLAYCLLRGPLVHWYPYPFLNVPQLGYAQVLGNSGLVLLCFLAGGAALIKLNHSLYKR